MAKTTGIDVGFIKRARENKRMTQLDVANALGMTLRNYQLIEAGKFPKFKKGAIKELDNILGANIYEQVYGSEIEPSDMRIEQLSQADVHIKYISLLERQNDLLSKRVEALEEIVQKSLAEIAQNQILQYSLEIEALELLLVSQSDDQERDKLLQTFYTRFARRWKAEKQKGNLLQNDKLSNGVV